MQSDSKQSNDPLHSVDEFRSTQNIASITRDLVARTYHGVPLRESLEQAIQDVRTLLNCDRVLIWQFTHPLSAGDTARMMMPFVETTSEPWPKAKVACSTEIPRNSDKLLHALDLHMHGNAAQASCFTDTQSKSSASSTPKTHLEILGVRSRAVVPLFIGVDGGATMTLWGALSAHHCRSQRSWSKTERRDLEDIAAAIALAIQQVLLYQQIQRQAIEFKRQVREQAIQFQQAIGYDETLKRITDKVRDSLDEEQIVQNAVREVAVALEVGSCNAAIYDRDRRTSQILYEEAIFLPAQIYRESDMSAFPELYDQLLDKQYFQFCSMSERNVDREDCDRKGRVAMLACSMYDNDGVIGDLWVVHESHHEFTDLEIRLVRQVANQCAIAIRQARLYQASQAQVAELEKLNQLKDDFLSTVSHELKTPISNMNMAIQMLEIQLKQCDSPEDARQRIDRYLGILRSECKREDELVTDLLDLQRLEDGGYSAAMSVIDLDKWLQKTVAFTRSRLFSRQQTLTIEEGSLSPLITDRVILDRIIVELLNNAGKYSADGSNIILRVSEASVPNSETTSGLQLCVTNPATIDPDELPKIFSKFYRVPNADPWKQGGTGLGLALVDRLVRQLGGVLSATSEDGLTTFTVIIPNHKDEFDREYLYTLPRRSHGGT
jgi:signal transduction histidine kinase